jgi:Uma2 family endonuclease
MRGMADAARAQVTVDVLDAFEDDEHVEVIDGELVRETTSFAHGDAQSSLGGEIKSRFRGDGEGGAPGWWIGTEVTVVYSPTRGFLHDVAGWRKDRVPLRPAGRKVTVRPDWVCEILSTNKRKDLVAKRNALHQAGVPHYWILDPDQLELTVLRHVAEGYLLVGSFFPGDVARLEPFDAVELDVTRLFGDIEQVAKVPSDGEA